MQRQKKGFWLFIFSLIPGAGEMYMGFKKQGISTMVLFWGIWALSAALNTGWFIMFLPILWFYSFFNVHNLKSLPEEEFYSLEDSFILHFDQLFGDTNELVTKHHTLIAVLLIIFGASILWNNLTDILYWILPEYLANVVRTISYRVPEIIIAVIIIGAGLYILSDRKKKLRDDEMEENDSEHYWEPYRPYQQPVYPQDAPTQENVPTYQPAQECQPQAHPSHENQPPEHNDEQ